MQAEAPNRQGVEERAEHHVDVQSAVVAGASLALVVGHQPHVLLVAGDGKLTFPLGQRDRHPEPLGGAALIGLQFVVGGERRIGRGGGGHDAAVGLDSLAGQLHSHRFHARDVLCTPSQHRRPRALGVGSEAAFTHLPYGVSTTVAGLSVSGPDRIFTVRRFAADRCPAPTPTPPTPAGRRGSVPTRRPSAHRPGRGGTGAP